MGLELVEIHLLLEEYFGVSIPEDRINHCRTFGDLVDAVTSVVQEKGVTSLSAADDVEVFLRKLLIDNYLIQPEVIKREASLFAGGLDLG